MFPLKINANLNASVFIMGLTCSCKIGIDICSLNRLFPATVFANHCIFFNNLCTIATLFTISLRHPNWKQCNYNNKKREKGTYDKPPYRVTAVSSGYNTACNACNKKNKISNHTGVILLHDYLLVFPCISPTPINGIAPLPVT